MKSRSKIFLFSSFSIFIVLFALNISIDMENQGVNIKEVSATAKANCMNLQSGGCDPGNWNSCNDYEGVGNYFIVSCENCEANHNAIPGDPDLCCMDDDVGEN